MMNEPPVMISTKDLSYICDIFKQNFNAAKLAHHYSEEVQDNEIKDFFDSLYNMHKEMCSDLINMIDLEENYEQ